MIEAIIPQKEFVQQIITVEDLQAEIATGGNLKIMMGQTFDEGQPVDMLKYALIIMNYGDLLEKNGSQTETQWLIADHFITDINQDLDIEKARAQVKKRVSYLQTINKTYQGNIGIVFSSELSQETKYKRNLEILLEEAEKNRNFKEKALKAVPKDRQDNPDALRYPFEEIATIITMGTDIKIGPVYEAHYDIPAREITPLVGFKRYVAIHLTKGFPLGDPILPQETAEEIETYGILPYKKNSKGLEEYRIDPVNDSAQKIQDLIMSTNDPRALVDLISIARLSYSRIMKLNSSQVRNELEADRFEKSAGTVYNSGPDKEHLRQLREIAVDSYMNYIHEHFTL